MSANILASFFHEPTTNSSNMDESLILLDDFNLTITSSNITINNSYSDPYSDADNKAFWFLTILPLPLVAVVGNILVILSVYKERSLQTVTNYFIVSLAFADLLVAAVVMPFALYVLISQVNGDWELSDFFCDFYIAVDVTCSTASIFNLVAISIDRFIAVTQPISYSKHRSHKRVWFTIVLVWLLSAGIGSPIVLGLNTSPERVPSLCVFYNADFIIYSSLTSFYIPCIAMIFLYYQIFKAIHARARRSKLRAGQQHSESAAQRSLGSSTNNEPTSSQQKRTDEAPQQTGFRMQIIIDKDYVTTNTGSNSQEDDEDDEEDEDTLDERRSGPSAMTGLLSAFMTETIRIEIPVNGNTDSGYGTSHVEQDTTTTTAGFSGVSPGAEDPTTEKNGKNDRTKSRFNLVKRHKSSRKKRERASAKKERKATKTLAIVLGMFLMCWVPFFTCNILDAICIKLENDTWRPGMAVFLITTWLGYINSCVNPVIYTIFNMEFRKAFKKILAEFWTC